jgi:predicted phosphoadenosine phosphosulfate sulfurtransferase
MAIVVKLTRLVILSFSGGKASSLVSLKHRFGQRITIHILNLL